MSSSASASPAAAPSVFRADLLKGQVCFVTGGGSGICKGIVEGFLAHGASCVITSRKQDRLDAAKAELEARFAGAKVLAVAADVRKPAEIGAAVDAALKHFGRIDVLVNGAAGNFLCPVEKLSENAFRTVVEIDLLGTYHTTKAVYHKWMKEHGGNILNISATLHYTGFAMQAHVGAAKAAIDAFMRHTAVEWGPNRIRVNNIAPGAIASTEGFMRLTPKDQLEMFRKSFPLQRFGEVTDIASAALFLVSPAASFITGHVLVVDGGGWMTNPNYFLLTRGISKL